MTEPPPPSPEPMAVLPYSAMPESGEPRGLRQLSWWAIYVCWVGAALIGLVSVETVLASGPVLFVLALVQVFWSALRRQIVLCVIAGGHLSICGVCVCLANAFRWGPGRAAVPFLVMGLAWAAGSTLLMTFRRSLASLRWLGGTV